MCVGWGLVKLAESIKCFLLPKHSQSCYIFLVMNSSKNYWRRTWSSPHFEVFMPLTLLDREVKTKKESIRCVESFSVQYPSLHFVFCVKTLLIRTVHRASWASWAGTKCPTQGQFDKDRESQLCGSHPFDLLARRPLPGITAFRDDEISSTLMWWSKTGVMRDGHESLIKHIWLIKGPYHRGGKWSKKWNGVIREQAKFQDIM